MDLYLAEELTLAVGLVVSAVTFGVLGGVVWSAIFRTKPHRGK